MKRQKLAKVLYVLNLKNEKCYTIYGQIHLHLKLLTSATTLKTCQTTYYGVSGCYESMHSKPGIQYLNPEVDYSIKRPPRTVKS